MLATEEQILLAVKMFFVEVVLCFGFYFFEVFLFSSLPVDWFPDLFLC